MNSLSTFAPVRRPTFIVLLLVLGLGIFLRIHSFEEVQKAGFDEGLYARYVELVDRFGVMKYSGIFDIYVEDQAAAQLAFLPPTRVTFILAAATWHKISRGEYLESVRQTSSGASIVFLLIATAFAYRLGREQAGLAVAILLAFAPTQIFMAHRALMDGFFAMMALSVLWTLWEVMQNPGSRRWLAAYGCALALIVLTKENAAFVYMAILGVIAANRFLKLGTTTKIMLVVTIVAPSIGFALLALFAGGFHTLFSALSLNVQKSLVLPYAILTGDGPWFRYLSDMILASPVVMFLAIGGCFLIRKEDKVAQYFFCFILFSYLIMGNLRYGINLRYTLIWDMPLRFLALLPFWHWTERIFDERRRNLTFWVLISVVAFSEITNYHRLFVQHSVFDLVPLQLLKALDVIK